MRRLPGIEDSGLHRRPTGGQGASQRAVEQGPLTSVRPGLFMEKKMRSTKRVLESSCFSVAGSEASLMPFVRPCVRQLVSQHVFR